MTSLKILAASFIVAISAPAFAGDIDMPKSNQTYEFVAQKSVTEGRNSAPTNAPVEQARATYSAQ